MTLALYFDHYMGSAHYLPTELKRNYGLMRELDAKVQSLMKKIDKRSESYLTDFEKLSELEKKKQRKKIHYLFTKARRYGDNKIQIAVDSYKILDKFMNRFDGKMEKGKSLMTGKKEKKCSKKDRKRSKKRAQRAIAEELDTDATRKRRCTGGAQVEAPTDGTTGEVSACQAGGSGTQAGGSASVKVGGAPPTEGAAGAGTPVAASTATTDELKGKTDEAVQPKGAKTTGTQTCPEDIAEAEAAEFVDLPVDPNEPTYCLCNQVSYGEMIACDNSECAIEWFHFPCVGLTNKPHGEWYCPKCTAERKPKPTKSWSRPKFVIKPK